MKIRMLVAGTLAIAGVLALPATAMAGEITGPPEGGFATGGNTPIKDGVPNVNSPKAGAPVAASICSFSGLNAPHPEENKQPAYPAVQSYGAGVAAGYKDYMPSPGVACNPTSGFEE
jgi:hypothetical protein